MNGIFTALLPDLLVPAGNQTHVSRASYLTIERMLDYRALGMELEVHSMDGSVQTMYYVVQVWRKYDTL